MATVIPGSPDSDILLGTNADDILLGYAGADFLYGFAGNDILNGGSGADRMTGGAGDDTYVVADAAAVIKENAGEGTDTVYSSVDFGLAANAENLVLVDGSSAFTALGNQLANTMTGNQLGNILMGFFGDDVLVGMAGADTLEGSNGNDRLDGGSEADTMQGGAGNDIYVVDVAGDKVDESGGGGAGNDTVQASISYSLVNSANLLGVVENLTLLDVGGTINGTGNAVANLLVGNAFNNILVGGAGSDTLAGGQGNDILSGGTEADTLVGGAGIDTLTGGAGNDTFVLNAGLSSANRDAVADFSNAAGNNDIFRLENAVMTQLGAAGGLNLAFFHVGPAAADANDFIVYNNGTGTLFYDSNGNVAGGMTQIAALPNKPALTVADFAVV